MKDLINFNLVVDYIEKKRNIKMFYGVFYLIDERYLN